MVIGLCWLIILGFPVARYDHTRMYLTSEERIERQYQEALERRRQYLAEQQRQNTAEQKDDKIE